MENDNFDLVLVIPCRQLKEKQIILNTRTGPSFKENSDSSLQIDEIKIEIRNAFYVKENLKKYAEIFCEQIEEHGKYELVFNDESSNIRTSRKPLIYGHVIIYKDERNDAYIPYCCYNFFAVLSELSVGEDSLNDNAFNLIYFILPDINYHDLTLLMDQSHEIWCNIMGKNYGKNEGFFRGYLKEIGYKYLGKIYRIVFSDLEQFKYITKENKSKLFNILASEENKSDDEFCHQIELSENTDEYLFSYQGKPRDIIFTKKEKFFDDYTMYSSYNAYASIYTYYYVIKEDKEIFKKRIEPDQNNANFSSEANILFVLETELFKVAACLVLGEEINDQMDNPNMVEIQRMFKKFINTRPLFEKLNYCYLGAQKEADFIYKQFRIGDILADYDRKRELLKNYSEVTTSVTANRNAKLLNCIGLIFTFFAGFDPLSKVSKILNERTIKWDIELIISTIVFFIIVLIIIIIIDPIKLKRRFKKRMKQFAKIFKK